MRRRRARPFEWGAMALGLVVACDPPRPAVVATRADTAAPSASPSASPSPSRANPPAPVGGGPRFVHAGPDDDVAAMVTRLRAETERDHRQLLVYVGATWCEPCQHFHRAVEAHALDATFPNLTLLEFDLDRDAARLQRAGYVSRMIPLFMRPGPDGRGTDRHIEGSIHGPGSVDQITPRLRALLD